MKPISEAETAQLVQVIRHKHVFEALQREVLDRPELEDRLGVSRATSHRYVRTLEEMGLVEKIDGRFTLTDLGTDVADAVAAFGEAVGSRLHLAPLLDATRGVTPAVDAAAFVDATVTTAERGDPYAPLTRFISLVQETDSLRGINTCRIAPTYMEEFQGRILDGMETELIDQPDIAEDIMENYPEKCVQVCVSGYLTLRVREARGALPFGLVIFDDRVGIGLFERTRGTLESFIDTDDSAALEWATEVYDRYAADSTVLEHFTKQGLRDALARC